MTPITFKRDGWFHKILKFGGFYHRYDYNTDTCEIAKYLIGAAFKGLGVLLGSAVLLAFAGFVLYTEVMMVVGIWQFAHGVAFENAFNGPGGAGLILTSIMLILMFFFGLVPNLYRKTKDVILERTEKPAAIFDAISGKVCRQARFE